MICERSHGLTTGISGHERPRFDTECLLTPAGIALAPIQIMLLKTAPAPMPTRSEATHHHLATLSDWIHRAQQQAACYHYNETKQAVRAVRMQPNEADAAAHLYELHSDLIRALASEEYRKRSGSRHGPGVDVDDVVQEAYILMLRSLVRYSGSDFRTHLRSALRDRIRTYLDSRLYQSAGSTDDRPEVDNTSTAGRDVETAPLPLTQIVGDMLDTGALSSNEEQQATLESLWHQLQAA